MFFQYKELPLYLVSNELIVFMTEQEKELYFKEIFKRNYKKLFLYALYMTGNQEEARDIISDVFRKFLETYHTILYSSVDSWLFITTKTRCIDWMRRQKRVHEFAKYYVVQNDVSENTLDEYDQRLETVLQVMGTLPEKTRRVMELCYLEEMSYKETGEVMGLQPNGVKKHIMKGLQAIRSYFNVDYKKGQGPKELD